ncbi:SDR family NAD(P)-dependent oxidoreductase, partial [Nocardia sp. 2TAF39]|uniref:SDR family NAD(P)-dependent oxidoreductase n=1 Tax=Nocardia sp. 2TAF39 TaxID=3233017 RepID=UPI003F983341
GGELVAAFVAGVWSLEDACALVAARGRLMGALPEGGAMLAVAMSETEVAQVLTDYGDRVSVAAVNGPDSVVISGDDDAVDEVERTLSGQGRKTSRLRVSHAFHSARLDPMLAQFRAVAEDVTYHEPLLPIVSNVTGAVGDAFTDPAYWVGQARATVRFAPGIRAIAETGTRRFLEIGPDAVLAAMTRQCLSDDGDATAGWLVSVAGRRGVDEAVRFVTFLAQVHVAGLGVGWRPLFAGSSVGRVSLPTYAFQHQRYWLAAASDAGDVRASGVDGVEHPLLGAAVWLPDSGGVVLTGRLSLSSHPWLADHEIGGTVLLPGTGFAELALHVGAMTGSPRLAELVVTAPLAVPPTGAVELRVMAAGPDDAGVRDVSVYSRPQGGGEPAPAEWVRHATGTLVAQSPSSQVGPIEESWPPVGAVPVDIGDVYVDLAERGYGHGPLFQGLTALWRRGGEVFAEVNLPEQSSAGRFGVHPALLDAALHAIRFTGLAEEPAAGEILVPYSWENVDIHAVGAGSARVRLAAAEPSSSGADHQRIMVTLTDSQGAPVFEAAALTMRPIPIATLSEFGASAAGRSAYILRWVPLSAPKQGDFSADAEWVSTDEQETVTVDGRPVAVIRLEDAPADADVPGSVHARLADVAARVVELLARQERIVVVTRHAVAVDDGEPVDLVGAAAWGLLRSAQHEHPDRIAIIDVDSWDDYRNRVAAASAIADESQVAVRDGVLYAPRLSRGGADTGKNGRTAVSALRPDGTVLITGGTGGLGAMVARHLVVEHGVRRLLLAGRRGLAAPGAADVVAELATLGAQVDVVACDVADPAALDGLLAAIPSEHPLTGVVHAAGVLADGLLADMTPQRLATVLRPKADAAWHLHEATKHLDLSIFVLYSSLAGTIGSPGQANYAAANAFLDAVAQHRHRNGLPATSIAWGPWRGTSGMTSTLSEADFARMRREGLVPLDDDYGMSLFDAAVAAGFPTSVGVRFDGGALTAQAAAGSLPRVLSSLVTAGPHRAESVRSLPQLLASAPESDRAGIVLAAVREQVAASLGHEAGDMIDPGAPFTELGFDSLAGVEFRNRLVKSTGLTLPSTLVFDHPTARALADHLYARITETMHASVDIQTVPQVESGIRGGLTELVLAAHRRGGVAAAIPMLLESAKLADTFVTVDDVPVKSTPIPLSRGTSRPMLICVPSFVVGTGPHQFGRLARELGADHTVVALRLPGTQPGEPLPESWDALLDYLAMTVEDIAVQQPIVLVGYSAGGAIAHALAHRLEKSGRGPAAVILLDTYSPDDAEQNRRVLVSAIGAVLDLEHEVTEIGDHGLVAMAKYAQIFDERKPMSIAAPTFDLRAVTPLPGLDLAEPVPMWLHTGKTVEIDADHFSIIGAASSVAADEIRRWLEERGDPEPWANSHRGGEQ